MKKTQELISINEADITLLNDHLMHVHIKLEDEFVIENSMNLVKARTELASGRKMAILYTATRFVIPSKEVKEFVASEGRSELVLADAFVINSLPQRLAIKFFIKFNKPVRPTRFFDNKQSALQWLEEQVEKILHA